MVHFSWILVGFVIGWWCGFLTHLLGSRDGEKQRNVKEQASGEDPNTIYLD